MAANSFEKDVAARLTALCGGLNGKSILVGLSGGADSVCLLSVLCALSGEMGFSVSALHVNHMIRGSEADRDEEFCFSLCKEKGVPFTAVRIDIPKEAKLSGESTELCARKNRYKAFIKHCEDNNIRYTATAHNADDNAETVLYNILRGSGTDGICGIPEKRGNIIRPLLGKTRSEILAYLSAKGQGFVTDSTNGENDYTRNFIRNVLIPSAARVNSDVSGALNRLSRAACADAEYMNAAARAAVSAGGSLASLPHALRARAVRLMCLESCGFTPESSQTEAICGLLEAPGEKRFSLPGGYTAVTCGGTLRFEGKDEKKRAIVSGPLAEGVNRFADGAVLIEMHTGALKKGADNGKAAVFGVSLNRAAIVGGLRVRSRQTGDCFTVRGINRSLKKCFINKKIPASERGLIPVVCDDEGIVYVPYIGAADRAFKNDISDTLSLTVSIERVGQKR